MPKDWADAETIERFANLSNSEPLYPGSSSIALNADGTLALVGGTEGAVGIYLTAEKKVGESYNAGGPITAAVWATDVPLVATSLGEVKILGDKETSFKSHAGSAAALAVHPSGDIVASVGVDKSFVFYDVPNGKAVTQIYTTNRKTSSHNVLKFNREETSQLT